MRKQALFLNGVYRHVLEGILRSQFEEPDETFYLQPYSTSAIRKLRDDPPTIHAPVRLYASTIDNLPIVSFCADIVTWYDKTKLDYAAISEIDASIKYHRYDQGFYDFDPPQPDRNMVNLISIRNLVKLPDPFSVSNLRKTRDGMSLSRNRTQAGGWSYVHLL